MATRTDVQLPVRVKPELLKRIDEARGDVSRTRWVTRAIEAALGPDEPYAFEAERQAVRAAVASGAKSVRVEVGSIMPASGIVMRFRCPDAKCERRFGSPAAVCPDHGRKAVEEKGL